MQIKLPKNIGKNYSNQIKKLIDHNQIPLFTSSNYPGLFNLTQIFSPNKDFPFTCLPICISAIPYISILSKRLGCGFVTHFCWAKTAKEKQIKLVLDTRILRKKKKV